MEKSKTGKEDKPGVWAGGALSPDFNCMVGKSLWWEGIGVNGPKEIGR